MIIASRTIKHGHKKIAEVSVVDEPERRKLRVDRFELSGRIRDTHGMTLGVDVDPEDAIERGLAWLRDQGTPGVPLTA